MNKKYFLTLADNNTWMFHSDNRTAPFLDKLAEIMELNSEGPDTDLSICFFDKKDGRRPEDTQQWSHYFFGYPIHLWESKNNREYLIELDSSLFDNKDMFYLKMSNSLSPVFSHAIRNQGFPFHAGMIEYKKQAVLIAAPGDVGKTTCCQRVPRPHWRSWCDDLCLLVKNTRGGVNIHPMPTWSDYFLRGGGKTWKTSLNLPLKAIFFLEQGKRDQVRQLSELETSIRMCKSVNQALPWSSEDLPDEQRKLNISILDNCRSLAEKVPSFALQASLTGKFWEEIKKVL